MSRDTSEKDSSDEEYHYFCQITQINKKLPDYHYRIKKAEIEVQAKTGCYLIQQTAVNKVPTKRTKRIATRSNANYEQLCCSKNVGQPAA